MRKTLLLAAAASMVLASCSNDENIMVPEKTAIGFESFVGKTTRADDTTTDNLTSMMVYGYIGGATPVKNFDGTHVRKVTGGDWEYTPRQYWTAGKDYFFTAVASQVAEGNSHYSYTWADALPTATAGFMGTGTISFDNAAASGNEDVVYAFATKTTPDPLAADPGKVPFSFKHALSRVMFTFENAMGSAAYTIKVYDLTINNADANGDLVLGAENLAWSNFQNTVVLSLRNNLYTPSTQTAANTAKVATGTKFIIPNPAKALNISFKVDLMLEGNVIATYTHVERALPLTAFQLGHSYNFTAKITPENIDPTQELYPIEFTVTAVEGWEEGTAGDIDLKK